MMIRAEQMNVFEATAEDNFVRRTAAHLLEHYAKAIVRLPDDVESAVDQLPEEKLRSLVEISVERARSYGLTYESSISAVSALMFEVAPNFDSHRLSQVLLNDENIEPDARLDELLEVLTEKNWEAIRAEYDVNEWESKPKEPENIAEAEDAENPVEAKNLEFAETVMNVENAKKSKVPAAAPNLDFDETVMNIGVTKKPAKAAKDEDFDFLDTVPNVDAGKE